MKFDQTCLNIDLDAVEYNLSLVRQKTGVQVMAVVKADAYGMGAVPIARALEGKCGFFGVSSIAEALELRKAGIRTPILILGRMPVSAYALAVKEEIRTTMFRYEDALALSAEAQTQGKTAWIHFAVDTGMSRIGFQATAEAADECAKIAGLPGIVAEGLFSHFACADSADLTSARTQEGLFREFDGMLKARGVEIPIRHMDNSAGIMNFEGHYEMVRSGIVTYGMYPSNEVDPAALPLKPVMQWVTRVAYIKTLPAGRTIGYGATYTTTRETVVATLPVGYADGFRRSLSGVGHVLIHGQKAPVLGRVCMDQIMVDVSHIPEVQLDDKVILIGRSGEEEITADAMAAATGTINYEIVCGLSRRIPRAYYRDGKKISEVHYLLDAPQEEA